MRQFGEDVSAQLEYIPDSFKVIRHVRPKFAYAGFHHLYGGGAIYEVACSAHARRKFHEIHVIHASPTTTEALARIGALYAIEDEVRGKACRFEAQRPTGTSQTTA